MVLSEPAPERNQHETEAQTGCPELADYGPTLNTTECSASCPNGGTSLGNLTYAYDAAGRRIQLGGSLASMVLPAAMSGATYDANGNLTSDGGLTYSWDSRSRLSALSGGATASFTYDGLGRRSAKTVGGTATSFCYDGRNVVQELAAGTPRANLLTGLGIDETYSRTDTTLGARHFVTDALEAAGVRAVVTIEADLPNDFIVDQGGDLHRWDLEGAQLFL
ncbi:hypothetical protein AWV79_02440 [Cupriavidus sp. UYMMa02A]|nr:hypothetical protein AWV79_02440 [Cupriavidus sp. UYMMa02A]